MLNRFSPKFSIPIGHRSDAHYFPTSYLLKNSPYSSFNVKLPAIGENSFSTKALAQPTGNIVYYNCSLI